jgi:hypothetical protein
MKTTILDALIPTLRIPDWMCIAGVLVFLIALWAVRTDIVRAHGLDKIVALSNLCFAIPLAVFGALHIAGMKLVLPAVPTYMPWRHFWAYFVGVALLLASLSIATNIKVKCSGLLFGIMMFLFVVMLEFPGALGRPGDRFGWTIVIREMAFAAGGWSLAASAMSWQHKSKLVSLSRVLIAVTAIFFSIEHFLHPFACPGVPLEKLMPDWIRGRLTHWLSDRCIPARRRSNDSAEPQVTDGRNLSRSMDCFAGLVRLYSNPVQCIVRPGHGSQD